MNLKSIYNNVLSFFSTLIGKIQWAPSNELTLQQQAVIREMLANDYYLILTRRKNHLSTYAIGFVDFIKTGKYGYYGHILMNTEDRINQDSDFRLVEAIGTGVQYTPFEYVFNVNAVALLKPKGITIEEWTKVMDSTKDYVGRPYDTIFDLLDASEMSCVELVRAALMWLPDYDERFANFEKMITEEKVLTPDMFYNCPDFEIVYEIR